MVIDFPDNCNIVVLSSYRTGSTAFYDVIAKQKKLINLDEIFHPARSSKGYDKIYRTRCVIKLMPEHLEHPEAAAVLKESFVVGITRRDVCAQIASFYICHMTNHWHQLRNQEFQSYVVPIDQLELENQINYINKINAMYRELVNQFCAREFYYEDLLSLLTSSKFDFYPRPNNYDQIYNAVAGLIEQ